MNPTDRPTCEARYYGAEQTAQCSRPAGHHGMHVGLPTTGSEGVQWKDSEPMTEEVVSDPLDAMWWLPPLGAQVVIAYRDGSASDVVTLRASVLNESGEIVAVLVDSDADEAFAATRSLVSWAAIDVISWERTGDEL